MGVIFMSFTISPILVAAATFVTYLGLGNELTPATAFTALSLFSLLSFPLGAIPMMARYYQ